MDQMVTNFFVLNFLEVLLVNGTENLLIESQAFLFTGVDSSSP